MTRPAPTKPADVIGKQSAKTPTRRDLLRGAAAAAAGSLLLEACQHGGPPPATAATAAGAPPAAGATPAGGPAQPGGLQVHGMQILRDGKPFYVSGFNYWAALPLSRAGNDAGWDQVRRDLDALQGLGINLIRTMAATEGPDTEPLRIVPSLQTAQGKYDEAGVAGLQRLVEELGKRKLHAIFMLNNFWQWSGGMGQYLAWAGEGPIPYPPPQPNGSYDRFQHFVGQFYKNDRAREAYRSFIRFIVPKLNTSPIVIWELCNEARGMTNVSAYREWIDESARLIKSLAPGQLVTTGSEGQTASPTYAGLDTVKDHQSPAIDFITFHMWAQNWNWVHPESLARDLPKAMERAHKYVSDHAGMAAKVGKPILLEEFGFARDDGNFDPAAPTTLRDKYFDATYTLVHSLLGTTPMAGIMPWAWSGDVRPPRPGKYWSPGDPFTGDPPHEQQGWYSVYSGDTTLALIKSWSARIAAAGGGAAAA
jgi:mannan endo-1,4-beta-mannosidase